MVRDQGAYGYGDGSPRARPRPPSRPNLGLLIPAPRFLEPGPFTPPPRPYSARGPGPHSDAPAFDFSGPTPPPSGPGGLGPRTPSREPSANPMDVDDGRPHTPPPPPRTPPRKRKAGERRDAPALMEGVAEHGASAPPQPPQPPQSGASTKRKRPRARAQKSPEPVLIHQPAPIRPSQQPLQRLYAYQRPPIPVGLPSCWKLTW